MHILILHFFKIENTFVATVEKESKRKTKSKASSNEITLIDSSDEDDSYEMKVGGSSLNLHKSSNL